MARDNYLYGGITLRDVPDNPGIVLRDVEDPVPAVPRPTKKDGRHDPPARRPARPARSVIPDVRSSADAEDDAVPDVRGPATDLGELYELDGHGGMKLHFHNGQKAAWYSQRRIILMLAGTQSGKTSFGPHWLLREIQTRGQGDYLVVAPTYPLLDLKARPAFCQVFESLMHLGHYYPASHQFIFTPQAEQGFFGNRFDPAKSTRVIFGYATEPESLESATVQAAWLDEAGQKRFKEESYQAVTRRLNVTQGRILVTTSLYALNWVKTLYDRARAGNADIEIVQFDSTMNPRFSRVAFRDARRNLASWRFNMMYRGQFDLPPGLIYDCVTKANFLPSFTIPQTWPRYLGLDFGTQNMAAVFAAEEPDTRRLFVYRTYHRGGLSAWGHVRELRHGESGGLPNTVGGAPSEREWRKEFRQAGLPVKQPYIADVQVGIDHVYGAFQSGRLIVRDDLSELKEELQTYSYKLNDRQEPTDEIEDKSEYHLLDALRYLVADWATRHLRIMRTGYIGIYDRRRRSESYAPIPPAPPGRTKEEVDAMLRAQAESLLEKNSSPKG